MSVVKTGQRAVFSSFHYTHILPLNMQLKVFEHVWPEKKKVVKV